MLYHDGNNNYNYQMENKHTKYFSTIIVINNFIITKQKYCGNDQT